MNLLRKAREALSFAQHEEKVNRFPEDSNGALRLTTPWEVEQLGRASVHTENVDNHASHFTVRTPNGVQVADRRGYLVGARSVHMVILNGGKEPALDFTLKGGQPKYSTVDVADPETGEITREHAVCNVRLSSAAQAEERAIRAVGEYRGVSPYILAAMLAHGEKIVFPTEWSTGANAKPPSYYYQRGQALERGRESGEIVYDPTMNNYVTENGVVFNDSFDAHWASENESK